MFKVGL